MRRVVRILAMACVLAAGLVAGLGQAQAPAKRVALVIGNQDYVVPAWKLRNPLSDAALMTTRLGALGFDVDVVPNGTRAQMAAAIQRFRARLDRAGPDGVGLFYYSGHGAEFEGANYLVPVDADVRTRDQLRFEAPSLQLVLDDMGQAGNAVNVVILDACRDNPLASGGRNLSRGGGLAEPRETPNVFIAYAAAPNQTAADGAGANSPFTAALAEGLRTRAGEPISLLFEDVAASVRASTGGVQRPRIENGLGVPRWSFAAGTATASAPLAPDPALERALKENAELRAQQAPPPAAAPVYRFDPTPGARSKECETCPEMVVVPSGSVGFAQETGRSGYRTRMTSFAIGATEVTVAQWEACVLDDGCNGHRPYKASTLRDTPVVDISWNDANAYIAWLNQRAGTTKYRLPSETEWAYAAGGTGAGVAAGTVGAAFPTPTWSWGDERSLACRHAVTALPCQSTNGAPPSGVQRVASRQANGFGLFDMHGNVWEWVADCYFAQPTYETQEPLSRGYDCSRHVMRGGAWYNLPETAMLHSRSRANNADRKADNRSGWGFRVARSL